MNHPAPVQSKQEPPQITPKIIEAEKHLIESKKEEEHKSEQLGVAVEKVLEQTVEVTKHSHAEAPVPTHHPEPKAEQHAPDMEHHHIEEHKAEEHVTPEHEEKAAVIEVPADGKVF